MADTPQPETTHAPQLGKPSPLSKEITALQQRVSDEAKAAVDMLEASLKALFDRDHDAANRIRAREEGIDREEVLIEREVFRLMTLKQPVAHDFRVLAFVLKINGDIERIADKASSIAKATLELDPDGEQVHWPTAMQELGLRVPIMCHKLLRAVADEDAEIAREVLDSDELIDRLEKELLEETVQMMREQPDMLDIGLVMSKVGRALERVGDLLTNIAEDVIYLTTGKIVRHERTG